MFRLLFFSFLIFIFHAKLTTSTKHSLNGTVYYDTSKDLLFIKIGVIDCDNGVACGYFDDTLNETGWGILEIKIDTSKSTSNNDLNDTIKFYAAGMLEGYLTSYEIYYNYLNIHSGLSSFMDTYKSQYQQWLSDQSEWIEKSINENLNDKYWNYVSLLKSQYNGVMYGYNQAAELFDLEPLNDYEFQWLSGQEDLTDLINVFDPSKNILNHWNDLDDNMLFNVLSNKGHCSALVKVTPELDDLYFTHTTWSGYYTMNRIYKHYLFYTLKIELATKHYSMSSYPGSMSSIDDWYIMDSGLTTAETTNDIFNSSLWSYLNPNTLFTWQRALIANSLAHNGIEWINIFTKYNSGTYNNQWIILDYKLFEKSKPLPNSLLYIAEQIPGNISSLDVTDILERGYFASYNVPAIEYIYNISGYPEVVNAKGVSYSYDLAPRGRIFRRDANNAINLTDIENLLRYNNYLNDPIENNNSNWAICARHDLQNPNPVAGGCIDTKVANIDMLSSGLCLAQAGPTYNDLPAFVWDSQWNNTPHYYLPYQYKFDFIEMESKLTLKK